MQELCDWPVSYVQCGGVGETFDAWGEGLEEPARSEAIADARALFEQMAAENLWNLSGRIFGLCDVELRPCRSDCGSVPESTFWGRGPYAGLGWIGRVGPWTPVLIAGEWFNLYCGTCAGACSCGLDSARTLVLPGPVAQVEEVLIDGVPLTPSAYRLDYGRRMLRTDGESWPTCQDLNAPDTAEGTFVVRYKRGIPVPLGGQAAAGFLAIELAKGACGDDDCALPDYVQSLTRQGLQVSLEDVGGTSASKPTGVAFVDNWLASVNKPRAYSTVRSVDVPKRPRIGATPWAR